MSKKIDLNKHIKTDYRFNNRHNTNNHYNIPQVEEESEDNGIDDTSPKKINNRRLTSNKNIFAKKDKDTNIKLKKIIKPLKKAIIIAFLPFLIILFLCIFLMMLIFGGGGGLINRISNYSLNNRYSQYSGEACYKVKIGDDVLDLEEYITGVIAGEVTGFSDEVLKAFAVSARTYLIYKAGKNQDDSDECYYDASNVRQSYHPEKIDNRHKNAVEETKGLIITMNGNIAGGHYDASCVYTAEQAKQLDSTINYDSENYYIRYGEWEIGGINFQPIPVSVVDKLHGSLKTYVEYANNGNPCYSNLGNGMSQNGAEYLSTFLYYNWKNIIDYYYNNQEEIVTIYETYGGVGDGTIFRQGDPAWGNIPLGNSASNMAGAGCAVTSIAIGISFSGTYTTVNPFDAGAFIKALNDGNCFTDRGWIKWSCSAISKIAPSVKYVSSDSLNGDNNSKIQYINSYPLNKYIVITHFKNSAHYSHYVNFQEFINENEYAARDPSPGNITTQKISEIDQIVIYSY